MYADEKLWRELLLNGSVKLFFKNSILDNYIDLISKEGFDIYCFDCSQWNTTNFHKDLASILKFPEYYGKNLDAFNDCLSDMAPTNEGFVLVFRNYDSFTKKDPEIAFAILDIIQKNSWRFLLKDIKLLAFVQSNDAKIHFPPLGGISADWNNEEWFDEHRGLK